MASGGRAVVPMRGADGTLLGVVSVDEPRVSACGPRDEEIDVLVAFAEHVIAAFEGVQVTAEAARDRASLRRSCSTSRPRCVDLDTADDVLESGRARNPGGTRIRQGRRLPCARRRLLPVGDGRLGAGRSRARLRPERRRPGPAARAGVRDRRVLPDRRTPSRRLSSATARRTSLAARWGRPARVVEPLAARAADRARWLAQRVHLGRRPVRLDAAVSRAPPGTPYVREPGDDGAARGASTSRP